MKKKWIVLLVGVALILSAAPSAMATHCWRCKVVGGGVSICVAATGQLGGREFCEDGSGVCQPSGDTCVPHGLAPEPEPLAAEFTVASVERLDEPQSAASETLVTSLETDTPSKR